MITVEKIQINERLVEKIEEMAEEHANLKQFAEACQGLNDIDIEDTLNILYTDILEDLPEELMEKIVVKFDKRMSELIENIERLETHLSDNLAENCGTWAESVLDDLSWAKIGIDKNPPPPLR